VNAVEIENVTKLYKKFAHKRQFQTLKSALLKGNFFQSLNPREAFAALKDVSYTIPQGSMFGIIGSNGSGKSTLLKLIAGISKPTFGKITTHGKISALIELGAGFHPEISGRENIFINGIMLGLSRKSIAEKFDEIVRFAELEDFIDQPVKTYSSGMFMRLGFAVAVNVDPDILLVDEVLAVGDEAFSHKCLDKINDFRRRNKTIVLVTHSMSMVKELCDSALWLKKGKVMKTGDPRMVCGAYLMDVEGKEEKELQAEYQKLAAEISQEQREGTIEQSRWGGGEIQITKVQLLDDQDQEKHVFATGERMQIKMYIRVREALDDFVFGIGIFNTEGICCYGTNTNIEEFQPLECKGSGEVTFSIDHLNLVEGTYFLDVAAHRRDEYPYDYHRHLYTFKVRSQIKDVGIFRPQHRWEFSPNIRVKEPLEQPSERPT
jgi:ABC-type polysaccharide/polyol phosphate transport system ATPase subunit